MRFYNDALASGTTVGACGGGRAIAVSLHFLAISTVPISFVLARGFQEPPFVAVLACPSKLGECSRGRVGS